jgi:hypothetical protein
MEDEFLVHKAGTVAVWFGTMDPSEARNYLEEDPRYYDEDDPCEFLSEFARDLGVTSYDHDFSEQRVLDQPVPALEFLRRFSFSEQYLDALRSTVDADIQANVFVILLAYEWKGEGSRVPFRGNLACRSAIY